MVNKIKQCQICKKTLNDKDDVVVCPICGAPQYELPQFVQTVQKRPLW